MKKYLAPVTYMALIFISSSIPMDKEIEGLEFVMMIDPRLQNILHIPIFALLSFLWVKCFSDLKYSIKKGLLLSIIFGLAFGIINELHQLLIPGRFFSLGDILFNLIGVIAGGGIGFLLLYRKERRRIATSNRQPESSNQLK